MRTRRKYPSQLNTVTVRLSVAEHARLKEISESKGITMAEALHFLLEQQKQGIVSER